MECMGLCCSWQILLLVDCHNCQISVHVCLSEYAFGCARYQHDPTHTLLIRDAISNTALHWSSSPWLYPFQFHVDPSFTPLPPSSTTTTTTTLLHPPSCYHPPASSFLSSLLSPPPYSLPSLFSCLPHFDPSLHPSLHHAGSAGIEAAFVSSVSSTLWRRRAEKQEAGRNGQKTWRETETKIEVGKWDKKTRTVGRQIEKKGQGWRNGDFFGSIARVVQVIDI